MDKTTVSYGEPVPIDAYGPGFFRVAGQKITGAILVGPGQTAPWDGYGDTAAILSRAADIDVLFVGTGAEIAHVPADFRDALEAAGIGVESMASPSACRLYNILVSEGRRVSCALLPV